MDETHIDLLAGESRGQPVFEAVHAVRVQDDVYLVLYSPGLVYGVAADDQIRLLDGGKFEVLGRGRNVAVRVYFDSPMTSLVTNLVDEVRRLGGRLDGQRPHGLAFTIPVVAGFAAIETLFQSFVGASSGCIWEFGNVYDEGGKPLNWWRSVSSC